jgi:hypothetical protein
VPGFGKGPFGSEPFGEWKWSRQVLYELIPELYRSSDPDGLFELFIESIRGQFDGQRRLIREFADLRNPERVRTAFNTVTRLKLGKVIVPQGVLEQAGSDGSVDGLFRFISPTGRFRDTDIGKEIKVNASKLTGNNRSVVVIKVESLTTVVTEPQLATDAGPLNWELREAVSAPSDHIHVEVRGGDVAEITPGHILSDGLADFEVLRRLMFTQQGRLAFRAEAESADGDIDGTLRFAAEDGSFGPDDVGKWLSISGSDFPQNNNRFEIKDIDMSVSPPRLVLAGFMAEDTNLFWAVMPRPILYLANRAVPAGVVEQEGVNGVIVGGGSFDFTSNTGNFTDADIGKLLQVRGSTAAPRQDRQVFVTAVPDANTLTTGTAFVDAETDIYWELRSRTLTQDSERKGVDAEIIATDDPAPTEHTLQIPTGRFLPTDIGLQLELSNSAITGNNGSFTILATPDEETVVISAATLTVDEGPLTWQVVSGDFAKAEVRAESLIKLFAPDFGIEIDNQESEARQRSWVRHVNAWLDRKGHEDTYAFLAAISGFVASVFPLYRLDASFLDTLPGFVVFEVGEDAPGRSGTDGAIISGATGTRFLSDSAALVATDVGRSIRIGNAIDSSNNKLFTVGEFIDANTVEFLPVSGGVTPDSGLPDIGTKQLTWNVVRLYSNEAPLLPRYDDFNPDALEEYIALTAPATDDFHVDKYCWEEDWAGFIAVTLVSTTNIEGNRYEIRVTPPFTDLIPTHDTKVPWDLPVWKLRDADDNLFTLETRPDIVGGTDWTFDVIADPVAPPVTGAATLEYQCLELGGCGFCKSNKIVVEIEPGDIASELGVAVERVLTRVLLRLNEHPKPIHVEIVPVFKQVLEATLTLSAEITSNIEVSPAIMAPLAAFFDDIPADDLPLDVDILAEIETTETVLATGGEP